MARQDCLFWQLYLLGQKKYYNMSSINTYFVKKNKNKRALSNCSVFTVIVALILFIYKYKKGGCSFSVYKNETYGLNIYMKGDDVSFGDVYIGATSLSVPDVC